MFLDKKTCHLRGTGYPSNVDKHTQRFTSGDWNQRGIQVLGSGMPITSSMCCFASHVLNNTSMACAACRSPSNHSSQLLVRKVFGNSRNPDSDPEDLAKMSKSRCSGKMKRIATCSIKIGDVPECIKRYPKPCSAIQVLVNVKWLTDKYYPLQPPSPLCTFKNMVDPKKG